MCENEINKLFNLAGIDFNAVISNWLDEAIKNIQEQHQDTPAAVLATFRDAIRQNMDVESLRNQYAAIYKRNFTHEEIVGLIAFYESSLGRKTAKLNQSITQECDSVFQAYFGSIVNEVVQEMLAEDND